MKFEKKLDFSSARNNVREFNASFAVIRALFSLLLKFLSRDLR